MAYFPAFLDLNGKRTLIIGGGKIAGDKLSHMLDFTRDITIVAPQIDERVAALIERYDLQFHKRAYKRGDCRGYFIVIVAVDDLNVQKEVYEECQEIGALCNAVDSVEYCDFIYPSYIKEGDLVIAFSTSGASPSLAKYLRRAIQKLLPKDIADFIGELKAIRQTLPKGKERMQLLDQKAKAYIQKIFKEE